MPVRLPSPGRRWPSAARSDEGRAACELSFGCSAVGNATMRSASARPQAKPETNEQTPVSLRAKRSNPSPRKNVQNRTGKRIASSLKLLTMTVHFLRMHRRNRHLARTRDDVGIVPLRKTERRRRVGNATMRSASAHFRRACRGGRPVRPSGNMPSLTVHFQKRAKKSFKTITKNTCNLQTGSV